MARIDEILAESRAAMDDFSSASERSAHLWTTPRAPGKWAPYQVAEHVALTLEASANAVTELPTKFPNLPTILRPLARGAVFNRILKKNAFFKAKTSKAFDPKSGPATPAEARQRLDAALAKFDTACRGRASSRPLFESTTFGRVSVEDYARFQALHIRHHRKQLPA
jgi:hypothetical protein